MGSTFRKIIPFIIILLQWVMLLGIYPGCANIQPPMGGPKDSIPPVLIKAMPNENTVNFKGNTIKFQFDEYIKLENLNENLIINPPAEKFPSIESKLRNLTVKIKDTLQPNTTYTFNFGDAIRDVNESNPFKNFSYSFSTGPYLDSLELTGIIIDAESGLPDSTLLVLLHSNPDDSAVAKDKPRFITRANGKGVFHFTHLPSGLFHVFALKDEGIKKYTSLQTPFAFYDSAVHSDSINEPIELRSFVAEKEEEKKRTSSINTRSKGKENPEDKKLKYAVNVQTGTQDLLGPLTVTFQRILDTIYLEKIKLSDTLFNPVTNWEFERDTTGLGFKIKMNWPADTEYKLLLEKGFAVDTTGISTTRNDTISFKTRSESEYGSLKLRFTGLDLDKNPVLQWVENDAVVLSASLNGNLYDVKLFKPGEYKIRILYDTNKNGIWDTGDYWKKVQPEIVIPVEQKISVKSNWENEIDVDL